MVTAQEIKPPLSLSSRSVRYRRANVCSRRHRRLPYRRGQSLYNNDRVLLYSRVYIIYGRTILLLWWKTVWFSYYFYTGSETRIPNFADPVMFCASVSWPKNDDYKKKVIRLIEGYYYYFCFNLKIIAFETRKTILNEMWYNINNKKFKN